MNAVERLWRAIASGDWASIRAQFHGHAVVELPHTGERFTVSEYAAWHHKPRGSRIVQVHAVVAASEDLPVAVHATITDADGSPWRCGAFYTMQQARIAHAAELWVPEQQS
jgi:hypothetical protein